MFSNLIDVDFKALKVSDVELAFLISPFPIPKRIKFLCTSFQNFLFNFTVFYFEYFKSKHDSENYVEFHFRTPPPTGIYRHFIYNHIYVLLKVIYITEEA